MQSRTTAEGRVAYLASPGRAAVVVNSLNELQGPSAGVVELPLGLMWLPDRSFDLSDDEERLWMYAIVLREARTLQHLRGLLHRRLLREMWPDLMLPRAVRLAWETRFPQLRSAAAA